MSDERRLGEHLGRALDRILHDLTDIPAPRVEPSDWQDWPGAESACLWAPDGSGTGVWLDTALPPAEQVVHLADQVQEWAVEELCAARRPTNWPRCPEHPDNHPMTPVVVDSRATWCCPRSGRAVVEIGRLPGDDAARESS
ncbi:hypothetical protein [Nocardioides sp.]|uniref:hypothetical protein n=1 Tax=Nocardioides sp. TaxID=35761 RepID=UPI0025DA6D05|nr:hypothetical protein [Nocardioides sp.]